MNIIVAVDKNWAIGFQNKLLNSIPEDMKFFRSLWGERRWKAFQREDR